MLREDRLLMPPPSSVYRVGTLQFEQALQRGSLHLSLDGDPSPSSNSTAVIESHSPPPPSVSQSQSQDDSPGSDNHSVPVEPMASATSRSSSLSSSSGSTTQPSRKRKMSPRDASDCVMEKTRFEDIIGHSAVKVRCDEILLPMALPTSVTDSILTGVRSLPASMLLYGPPGCGKTKLVRALAGEAQAAFLPVAPSDVFSKFVGESETSIREIFAEAWELANQLHSRCAVVFFDEIDALAQARGEQSGSGEGDRCSRRVLAELLTQLNMVMDRNSSSAAVNMYKEDADKDLTENGDEDDQTLVEPPPRIIVVAATNRPEDCDAALLRRFGIQLYVGLPTAKDRKHLLLRFLKGIRHCLCKVDLEAVVSATEGCSGSDIENVAREAVMAPVRECIREAAIVRRRVAKLRQVGAGMPLQHNQINDENLDPEAHAQSSLLSGFQRLRPVTRLDFERAIEFTLHGRQHDAQESWYDSSSDEEERGEDESEQIELD